MSKLEVAEKLIIPTALAIIALAANIVTYTVSKSQIEIAKSELSVRQDEFDFNVNAKLIELFYSDINSGDARKQAAALDLLKIMNPELALKMTELVRANPTISSEIKEAAQTIRKDIQNFGVLNNYKLGIYVYSKDDRSVIEAENLQNSLEANGFRGIVQIYKKDRLFFEKVGLQKSKEIRYESKYESEAATRLKEILEELSSSGEFTLRPVSNRTTNFISIFLPTEKW